jgi:hypothetical protein
MIQPNSSGLMMPPRLKPVETMPNARPAAPETIGWTGYLSMNAAAWQPWRRAGKGRIAG